MANRAMFYGPDDIMNAFEAMRGGVHCCWSMWSGNLKLTQYNGCDIAEAENMLLQTVTAGERRNNKELLQVRIHPRVEDIYSNKSPVIATLLCSCVSDEPNAAIQGTQYDNALPAPLYHALKDMIAEASRANEALLLRLEAIEKPDTAVDPHWIDRIGGMLEKPEIAGLLGQLITALPGVLSTAFKQPVAPHYAIGHVPHVHDHIANNSDARSSIANNLDVGQGESLPANIAENSDTAVSEQRYYTDDENDIIDTALGALANHMDVVSDLPLLAVYADKNPEMFKMLLMQLKAQ